MGDRMTHSLRYVLIGIAGFLTMSLLLEVGARVWVNEIEPTQLTWYDESVQLRMDDLAATPRDVDVLFVGTSAAWQSFVPSEFTTAHPDNPSAYNAGMNGAVPVVVEPWLDTIVAETTPETVVWGLTTLDFATSYGDAAENAWSQALSTRQGVLASMDRTVVQYSALLEWRRTIVNPAVWANGDERDAAKQAFEDAAAIIGPDGERLDFVRVFTDQRVAVQQARLADMTPDPDDIAAVLRAAYEMQQAGITVVLVKLPITQQMIELHPMGAADVQRIHSVIDEIARSLEIETIDMSTGFDDRQFVDLTHLDEDATRLLTQRFAQALEAAQS